MTENNVCPIAIVGFAFRFPGDLAGEQEYWQALADGRDLVTEIDASRWATEVLSHPKRSEPGRSITFSAGVLSRVDEFDAEFFGISPREAAWLDPQQRLLLEMAWEAMENGGLLPSKMAGSDCAVYVGISSLDYGTGSLDDMASFSPYLMTGNTLSIAANRLSYVFDLRGPSLAVDTACSSSLVALHHACNCLRNGEASMAMVGGVNMLLHPYPFVGFTKASMLSGGGRCRTFDASGDGYVRSEGGAVLLLKPLDQAIADGDRVHAVVRASGVNADGGRKTGLTIPSGEGQSELMRAVLAKAGIAAGEVDYLEAHGTGTAIGDPIETAAIGQVYGGDRRPDTPLPIGSVKTNLGHLEPASGMAGLVKAILMLKHRWIPPSLHLETRNSKIDFEGLRLQPVTEGLPLAPAKADGTRIVGVNSFGFGGANAHVLLQEANVPARPSVGTAAEADALPLVLSARSQGALRALAHSYAELLGAPDSKLYDVAYAAAYRRDRLGKRLAVWGKDAAEFAQRLEEYVTAGEAALVVEEDRLPEPGRVGFVYSGNGAQWVGMGRNLIAESPEFREVLTGLDAKLKGPAGFSVLEELQADAPQSRMDDTAVAQPLLFAIQVAITELLRAQGLVPEFAAGHSVGEVAAAWAAGALSLDDAIRVICARSAAQALTRGGGRMAALSMAEGAAQALMDEHGLAELEIAGINSPENLTLSGPLEQLEELGRLARARGCAFRLLDLDYAFHSRSMDAVEGILAESLQGFEPTACRRATFVSTVTGEVLDGAPGRDYWWENIRRPVRFAAGIERMYALGCRVFVEIGPNAILQRYLRECLAKHAGKGRILRGLKKNADGADAMQELALRLHLLAEGDTLARFFPVAGAPVDLPTYPWQREHYWRPTTSEGYRLVERKRVHPLLGWRLKELQAGWENVLDPRVQPWLRDHRVGGAVVLAGAAYVEMALAASREFYAGADASLEELDILAPIVFDEEHGRSIRLELNARDGSFQIRSRQRLSEDEWTLNAAGRLLGAVTARSPHSGPEGFMAGARLDAASHYRLTAALGLDYGGAFRGLEASALSGQVLDGVFAMPAELAATDYLLHPAQLDICFQSLVAYFRDEIEAGHGLPLLPVKVGRLDYFGKAPVASFRARLLRRSLRSVLAEFDLFDAEGNCVATLRACRFRAAALRQDKATEPAVWENTSRLQPGSIELAGPGLPSVAACVAHLESWFSEAEPVLQRAAYYQEAQPLLGALAAAFVYEAFAGLAAEAAERLESVLADPGAHPLLAWAYELMQEQGWLAREDGVWRLLPHDLPPAAEIWRTLLVEHPGLLPELVMMGRVGRELGAVFAGRQAPERVAGELRESHQQEVLLDESASYRGTRQALQALIAFALRELPAGRPLRVLEVVAAQTELPRYLRDEIDTTRIDYTIGQCDPKTRDALKIEFQDEDWVAVAAFDLETPALEGASTDRFDLIVLRHLIHGSDARALLAWAREHLAADGLIALAEREDDLAADLLSGIDAAWWRHGESPLLPAVSWCALLEQSGFATPVACREPVAEDAGGGGYLVIAGQGAVLPAVAGNRVGGSWLILERQGSAVSAAELVRGLAEQGVNAIAQALAEEACMSAEAASEVFAKAARELGGMPEHVVLLAGHDAPASCTPTLQAFNLVQAVAAQRERHPRLYFVTSGGALANARSSTEPNPAHGALWGLGRVVMNEYPDLGCTLIDVAAPDSYPQATQALFQELLHADREREVVLDAAGRSVLRMRRTAIGAAKSADSAAAPGYRLDFRVPGQLRNLIWFEQAEKPLGPEQIEVRTVATGLNFRDVMYVMGLLPDEAVENGFAGASLGLEFSGVVTRVGSAVRDYVPGDAVMGFGSACFASHVVTRANAVTRKPDAWSFEAAATVPTVFFTVYYALKHLANLQPGERVLIHGAAGGVGIAAIQVARHLGAEVFATAGSPEKRDFVALLGADHVFDSRSLAFGERILERTGGEGVDVVLNSLAGEAIRRNLRVLRPFGRFLELGKRDFFENTPIGLRPFKDNISYFGIDADQLLIARPELAARLFQEVMGLFGEGVLAPLPYRAFQAERIVEAFRYMQQARQIGKVVVSFAGAQVCPQPLVAKEAAPSFDAEGCYLITGGLTGFGFETAKWMALHGARHFLLLSRRGPATPGAEAVVVALAALGAKATLVACDVTDAAALESVLARTGSDLPPLKGVLHAAMVIDDALMANLDTARVAAVLKPKVEGAWNLHRLSREIPLDLFVVYSSVTTFIGNPGQANYVAANAAMEALAALRRREGLPVTCIGWGPIGDAGYLTTNQAVKDSLAHRLGAEPLSVKGALRMLGKALVGQTGNLAIADFQWSVLSRLLPSAQIGRYDWLQAHAADSGAQSGEDLDFRALIEGKSEEEVRGLIVRLVSQEVAGVLGVMPERVDPVKSLHDMGLDSLMGVELALGLERRFGIQMPAMLLNEGPTVERVCERICERLFGAGDENGADQNGVGEVAKTLLAQHGEDAATQELLLAAVQDIQKI